MLDNKPNVTLHFHNTCVTTYNWKSIINRYLKQNSSLDTSSQPTPPKLLRCHSSFNCLEHCLICGDLCLEKATKNPGHHKKVVWCQTIHMKDNLIKVCGQRGDSHEESVSSRITGAITDLYAADAQYHQTCFTSFVSWRNISAAVKSKSKQQKPDPVNFAFSCVISLLKSDLGKLWNSVELYDVYSQSLKQLKDLIMVMKDSTRGPTEGACPMVVPAMSTRPRTSALRMPSTQPPSGTAIIGSNILGNCPWMALSSLKYRQYSYSSKWNNPDT